MRLRYLCCTVVRFKSEFALPVYSLSFSSSGNVRLFFKYLFMFKHLILAKREILDSFNQVDPKVFDQTLTFIKSKEVLAVKINLY